MVTYAGPLPLCNGKETTGEAFNKASMSVDNAKTNKYEVRLERLGHNRIVDGKQKEKVFQKGAGLNTTVDLEFLEEKINKSIILTKMNTVYNQKKKKKKK